MRPTEILDDAKFHSTVGLSSLFTATCPESKKNTTNMSHSARARVFSGYRRLFRARSKIFGGDDKAMHESRVAIKAEFVRNKNEVTSGPHFEGLLTMVDEAEDMLLHGLARGNLNENTGNFGKLEIWTSRVVIAVLNKLFLFCRSWQRSRSSLIIQQELNNPSSVP